MNTLTTLLTQPLDGLNRKGPVWFRKIAFISVSLVLAALLIEGALRIAYTVYSDERTEDWAAFSPHAGWTLKPNYRGTIDGVERETDARGFLTIDTEQISDTIRPKVLFIGDSNTFGWGVRSSSTFVEILENLFPGIDAINLGVPGYTSYQGYQLFATQGISMHPDVVVVSFNFNDRRYVLEAEHVDGEAFFRNVYRQQSSPLRLFESSYALSSTSLAKQKTRNCGSS